MPKGIPTSGTRKAGAGRKTGPKTETVAFRIPVGHKNRITIMIRNYLKELKTKPTEYMYPYSELIRDLLQTLGDTPKAQYEALKALIEKMKELKASK
jgi:hypothetical protein